jgi:hypothetical protein
MGVAKIAAAETAVLLYPLALVTLRWNRSHLLGNPTLLRPRRPRSLVEMAFAGIGSLSTVSGDA